MNLPNKLTIMRMVLVPVMVTLFYLGKLFPICYIFATIVFIVAAFTDFLDGYIARKQNLVTDFGKFMDPLADKALVLVALILVVDFGIKENLVMYETWKYVPSISLIVMLIRELVVSGLRLVGANKGVVIAADKLGKIKTVTQDVSLPMLLLANFSDGAFFVAIEYIGLATLLVAGVVSVISGISYVSKNISLFKG